MYKLDIKILTPNPSKEAQEQIATIGLDMFNLLQTFEHIRRELERKSTQKPHIMWQLTRNFIISLSTDTNQVHSEIVRAALNSLPNNPLNEKSDHKTITNILAQKLNESCDQLKLYLSEPKEFYQNYQTVKKVGNDVAKDDPLLTIIEFNDDDEEATDFESVFKKNEMFIWDDNFLIFLSKLGKSGQKTAKNLRPLLKENFKNFQETKRSPLDFWFNLNPTQEKPFYLSPALQIIVQIIWEEEVSSNSNLINNGVPAITNIVQPKIIKAFSCQNAIKDINEETIGLFEKNTMLGSILIPTASPQIINYIRNGLAKFDSVTAQRLIRHLIKWPFEKLKAGVSDHRLLRFNGGFKEVAECIGLKSKQEITKIKSIAYALDHFKFVGPEIASRLINLAIYKSPITHRYDACEITVLSPLLPYRTFEDGGLLIPLLNDPPLVGNSIYHARQFNLQWYIIAEFSNQSVSLAKHKTIQITKTRWEELLNLCKIPQEYLLKIHNSWTGEEGFLERIEKDFYTLKKENYKELKFLQQQGLRRIQQRENALKSIEKRKAKINNK